MPKLECIDYRFILEPFCKANAARSLHDENVLSHIQQAFYRTDRALKQQKPLESVWSNPHASPSATSGPILPPPVPAPSTIVASAEASIVAAAAAVAAAANAAVASG